MGYIVTLLSLFLTIIAFFWDFKIFKRKNIFNPIFLFLCLWTFILFLSSLNLYNIIKPSNESYLLISLMETYILLGAIAGKMLLNNKSKLMKEYEIKYKMVYFVAILIIAFSLIDCAIIIKERLNGVPMWQIRNWTLMPYGSENPILSRRGFLEEALRTIILAPSQLIIFGISAYDMFFSKNKKRNFILFSLSIVILILTSIAGGGGRLSFITFFFCYVFALLLKYKNSSEINLESNKKIFKYFILGAVLSFLITIILTSIRTGKGHFIKQVYTYFALAPTLLSIWLPLIKINPHTYGMLTTFGFHSYIFRVLEKVGLKKLIPNTYHLAYSSILNAEKFKYVGFGKANAFVSPIYYFMIDGGVLFVVLASVIFGFVLQMFYNSIGEKADVRKFLQYVLVIYGVFISFMRIQTCIPSYIISFVLIYFLTSSKKIKEAVL